ncbi:MAG: hydroxyisourate hydrolase [Opitutales bacterium]|nr:hydroxyisourate hydrolase [Opitutales bacterium]NRA27963.1 hydroxyisourate hydrolase [Opitutales bacterium]
MGKLSTHILDTYHGTPAGGVSVELWILGGQEDMQLKTLITNTDGRTDGLLLDAEEMAPGRYELVFHIGDYFRDRGVSNGNPGFLDIIPIRFGIDDVTQGYHVPLLVSPWSYSTYRGS